MSEEDIDAVPQLEDRLLGRPVLGSSAPHAPTSFLDWTDDGHDVDEVRTIKLPPFWKQNPASWFAQIEAQSYSHRIRSEDSKFFTAVGALDSAVLNNIADIILSPPKLDKYQILKERLIACFADSEEKRMRTLLTELELGSKRASQFLWEMKTLAADKATPEILRSLWMKRMRVNVRTILSVSKGVALTELAEMADKIMEVSEPSYIVAPVEPTATRPTKSSLELQVEALCKAINELVVKPNQDNRRSRSRSRSNSKSKDE
ncbi:uncharacterized protein LOC107263201 [Cephus cinctus]|uniref:Uncharacterized protein LOC107263201 n=1 Tax=Cephus cinctus TaxID=211228 RepID=A0AAJ7BH99_CEPCN|nr:uncharacterized protein LOC107263201 [Cephus cinctus]